MHGLVSRKKRTPHIGEEWIMDYLDKPDNPHHKECGGNMEKKEKFYQKRQARLLAPEQP